MPVLPAVPSTTVPPGLSRPFFSASSMIASAARSFTEPPGFRNSALPRISQPVASERVFRRISGVLPTEPQKPFRITALFEMVMAQLLPCLDSALNDPAGDPDDGRVRRNAFDD